jgi:hypothetical protein
MHKVPLTSHSPACYDMLAQPSSATLEVGYKCMALRQPAACYPAMPVQNAAAAALAIGLLLVGSKGRD